MSNSNIKEIIRQEYIKCSQDPVHFMRKYCYIQHPQRGRIQFNLYPFQEKVLTLFKRHDYSIVLKSRQLGISTLAAGYATWLMLFHKDRNVLALATTQATARNLVSKVKFMWENLPKEPFGDVVTYNPYKYDSFIIKSTEEPVFSADLVEMINSKNKIFIVEN